MINTVRIILTQKQQTPVIPEDSVLVGYSIDNQGATTITYNEIPLQPQNPTQWTYIYQCGNLPMIPPRIDCNLVDKKQVIFTAFLIKKEIYTKLFPNMSNFV